MKQGKMSKALAWMLALVMVITMMPAQAFASGATQTFPFGENAKQLAPGKYDLPISMKKATNPNQDSMAASAIRGAVMTVADDGSASVTIKMSAVTQGGATGWGDSWQIYSEYGFPNESELIPCEYTEKVSGNITVQDSITFKLPYTDKDGVYVHMHIDIMGSDQDAFFKMDFDRAVVHVEKPEYVVNFASGENGKLTAEVNQKPIQSGESVTSGEYVTFRAIPNEGYGVEKWTGIEGVGNEISVPVDRELNVGVNFIDLSKLKHMVSFKANANGKINAYANGKELNSGAEVVHGTKVTFKATPNDGYKTVWSGVAGKGNEITVEVVADTAAVANFELIMNTEDLQWAIMGAESVVEYKAWMYLEDAAWATFIERLAIAKDPNQYSNQVQVDRVCKDLNDAQNALNMSDTGKLDEALKAAQKSEYQLYTPELQGKIYKMIYNYSKYSQGPSSIRAKSQKELDDMASNLNTALEELNTYATTGENVAAVYEGENLKENYKSLQKALNAATETQVVKLLKDTSACIAKGTGKTLDLAGHTLTMAEYTPVTDKIETGKDCEVEHLKNGTLNGNVALNGVDNVTLPSDLVVNGQIAAAKHIIIEGATVNVPEGKSIFYSFTPKITVNGNSKITSKDGYAIQAAVKDNAYTEIVINNGTFEGKNYAIQNLGNVTINDGKFKASTGVVLGTIPTLPEGKKLSKVADENGYYKLIAKDTVENLKDIIAIGNAQYNNVEDAFKAVKAGETVKLLADVTISNAIDITKNCVIDLDGHTLQILPYNQNGETHSQLNGEKDNNKWCALNIAQGAKVDIIDKSAEKTGKISQISYGNFDTAIIVYGELTATDVIVENLNDKNHDFSALMTPFNDNVAKITLDNVKLSSGNKGIIVGNDSLGGTVTLKNITATFNSQANSLFGGKKSGFWSTKYIVENCKFTDYVKETVYYHARCFSSNLELKNTTWTFENDGYLYFDDHGKGSKFVSNGSSIISNNGKSAVLVNALEGLDLTDTTVKAPNGIALDLTNSALKKYTIQSGTYEGKECSIKANPLVYINGGKFKGKILGTPILPEGKILKMDESNYYVITDGTAEQSSGEDLFIYNPAGKLVGKADFSVGSLPMAIMPDHGKVVLQKDVDINFGLNLSMIKGGSYTFDLNGHNIKYSASTEYINIANNTAVKFIDSLDKGTVNIPTDPLYIGVEEGTSLTINGGTWNVGMLLMGQAGKVNVTGGHINYSAEAFGYKSPGVVVTGGDFNKNVSIPYVNWDDTIAADPVPHDTHGAIEKDGRWYVMAKADMPAPEKPVITPESKNFLESDKIEVSISKVAGTKVYYTLDGTEPTSKSTEYTKPFTVDKTTTVKAIAISDVTGKLSTIAEATYTLVAPALDLLERAKTEAKKDNYTADSLKALNEAIESAEKTYANKEATADMIDKANKDLDKAIKGLVHFELLADGKYSATATMKHEYKDQNSMCDPMFDGKADIEIKGNDAIVKLLVANPVPAFADQGKDGTVKNVVVNYDGKQYAAESQLGTEAKMTAKDTNTLFGFDKGKQYAAQVLTVKLPKAAVYEGAMLKTNAYVNVVMMTDVIFRINLTDIVQLADYSKVDAAIANIPADLTIYTEETVKAVTDAKEAVVRGLDITKQEDVDKMAEAIDTAVNNLKYKDADYSKVDAAIAKIPADLTIYTAETVKAVTDARDAVDRNLDITKQAEVDKMAEAITKAVAGLIEKPEPLAEGKYKAVATMKHEYKDQNSMCDIMFDGKADIEVKGEEATLKLLVANPVPGFADQGADGTVKNVVVNYDGKQYAAESQLGTEAKMTAKDTNTLFGFEKGKQYAAQVLTITLPKAAVYEGAMLKTNAYVNVVMMTDVVFRINLTDIVKDDSNVPGGGGDVTPVPPVEPEKPSVKPEVTPAPILPIKPPTEGADLGMDKDQQVEADKTIGEIITDIVNPTVKPEPPKTEAEKETVATEEKIAEAAKNNDKIKVNVETEKVDEEKASDAIKKEIADIKDKVNEIYSEVGGKLLQFADITVTAQAVKEDGTIVDLGNLRNLDKKLSFTFQLPMDTEGDKFGVIRYHDGKAEIIPATDVTYDPVTKKITFLTDKFSTYAVFAYDKEPEVTPVPPVRPAKVENLKIRTDYGLLKVTFDKSKEDVELYRIAVRKHGDKAWKYYETKNNSLIIKKLNGKALVKSARYDVMVAAVRDKAENIRSYYTKVKTVYANKSGVKAYKMYSPRFESIKRYNSGKTKVVVRNVKYTGETYQVAFRVKGTKTWKNTHYSTKTVRYITGLKKGKTYQFKVNYRYKSKLDGKTYVYSNSVYKYAKIR